MMSLVTVGEFVHSIIIIKNVNGYIITGGEEHCDMFEYNTYSNRNIFPGQWYFGFRKDGKNGFPIGLEYPVLPSLVYRVLAGRCIRRGITHPQS